MIKTEEKVRMYFPEGLGYLLGIMYCSFLDCILKHRNVIYLKSYLLHT